MNPNQIRIIVPVSLSDVHLLEAWVNVFRALGGALKSRVEFFPTPPVTAATHEAAKALRDFCAEVEVRPTNKDFGGGWPRACNAHFGHVVRDLAVRQNTQPWLWAELDALPMVPGAFERLSNEYLLTGGRGQMGVIMPVVKIINKGLPNQYIHVDEGDLYMVGVAIYDPMYYQMLEGIADQPFSINDPFDVFLRHYAKRAWRSTDQITTMSRTIHYRIENETLVCEDTPGKTEEYEKRGGIVPRGTTVFHHGCKDLSLAKVLVAGAGRSWQTIPQMLLAAPVPRPVAQSALPEIPKTLEPAQGLPEGGSDSALAAVFAEKKAQHPDGNGALQHPAQQAPQISNEAPLLDRLKAAIKGAPKPVRIANWADQLGVPLADLKSVATKKGSGITIQPGGWAKIG